MARLANDASLIPIDPDENKAIISINLAFHIAHNLINS